jgi:peroxiredoxin
MIEPNDTAPDFTLEGAHGEEIREFTLSEYADDRPVALVFYVYDYSPVCTTQMCEVNDMELLTFNDDVGVLGISTDGPYSHLKFIEDNDLTYPLLSDGEKQVYEEYGMIETGDNGTRQAKRGLVLVDSDLTVQYAWQAEDNWDEWEMQPLSEIDQRIRELPA